MRKRPTHNARMPLVAAARAAASAAFCMPRPVIYQFETSKPMPNAPTSGTISKPMITLTVPR